MTMQLDHCRECLKGRRYLTTWEIAGMLINYDEDIIRDIQILEGELRLEIHRLIAGEELLTKVVAGNIFIAVKFIPLIAQRLNCPLPSEIIKEIKAGKTIPEEPKCAP